VETIYDLEYVQKRLKYVLLIRDGHMTISEGARKAGVTWKTMKSWIHRYNGCGIKGLLNKPRGRLNPIPDNIRQIIVGIKTENRSRSGRKIRDILLEGHEISLHRQTVWTVLKAVGENKRVKQTFKVYNTMTRYVIETVFERFTFFQVCFYTVVSLVEAYFQNTTCCNFFWFMSVSSFFLCFPWCWELLYCFNDCFSVQYVEISVYIVQNLWIYSFFRASHLCVADMSCLLKNYFGMKPILPKLFTTIWTGSCIFGNITTTIWTSSGSFLLLCFLLISFRSNNEPNNKTNNSQ